MPFTGTNKGVSTLPGACPGVPASCYPQHLSQPAGSPLRLLLGDGYTGEQLLIKSQGLDPPPNGMVLLIKSQGLDPPPERNGRYLLSVHGEDLPAQDVSVAKALSMCQRGGRVSEGGPRTRGEVTYQRGGHVPEGRPEGITPSSPPCLQLPGGDFTTIYIYIYKFRP